MCSLLLRKSCSHGGRSASTVFYHIASDEADQLTLLRVVIETGRTHQIRVHLKHLRAPILGDDVYGYELFNKKFKRSVTRPLLHAYQLKVEHPITGQPLSLEAPIPSDFLRVIENQICPDFAQRQEELLFRAEQYNKDMRRGRG